MKTISVATLRDIVNKQDAWGYNRQVEPSIVDNFQNEKMFGLSPVMHHHHKHGEPCEQHLRTFLLDGQDLLAYIDMPIQYYDSLA
jgi:hypothetical protein